MAFRQDIQKAEQSVQEEIREPLVPREKTEADEDGYGAEDQTQKGSKGHEWMVYFSTFVAVCGSYAFGSCAGYSSPTQSAIREELNLSLAEAMRMSSGFCTAGWLAIYFAEGPIPLDIGRLATGYGMGVFSYVVPVFIAEIAPKNLRGALTTTNQLMICTGVSVAFIIGTVLTWRTLALTGIIPCGVLLIGLFIIPESPRWLAKIGRQKEFEAALRRLRGKEADIAEEAAEIQVPYFPVFSNPSLSIFHNQIGVGLMVFQQFGGINGICFYVSSIFESAGFPSDLGTIIYAILQVSASGLVSGCVLAGISFYLKSFDIAPKAAPALAVTGILLYIGSFSAGMGAVPWVVMSEVFPINVKGVAGSLATLVNWFGAWAVSYTFNFLMSWSSYERHRRANRGEKEEKGKAMSRSLGIPVKLLHEAAGHVVTVELKSGELYRGSMIECEDNWNCQLESITYTAKDGKISQLEHVFIRGSKVRFMVIPDMLKNAPMFKRLEARIKGKGSALGVGRGRAVAMRARAQAAGRGAPPGRGAVPPVRSICICSPIRTVQRLPGWQRRDMAMQQDIEKAGNSMQEEIKAPLLPQEKTSINRVDLFAENQTSEGSKGNAWMLYLSTLVAICGSFAFGSCAGFSSPTQTVIRQDLNLSLAELMICTGVSVAFIIGTVLTWRTLALTGLIPCGVLLLGLFIIPESPRWLAKTGREKEFEFALRRLRGKDTDTSEEAAEIQIGVGLMVFQQFGGINGICFYVSSIFESVGFPSNLGTIVYACLQTYEIALKAAPALAVTGILMTFELFYLLILTVVCSWSVQKQLYIGSFSAGMGAVPWVVMSEIFPINIKGVAGSLATLVNWFGAWAVSYTFNFLMSWSSYGTFILYATVNAIAIVFVVMVVPETKGRALEQIQAAINGS
ncbi:hypothetical protein RJ639_013051 [Escallonia herrerae]|uniref:Uncharacterized protein n=1 Tax=Escallonia herrerae TaxID=1293975 RepID=A0AA89APL0_9ASTE|nr:hypothetical protein RJ639_013051 [Escallonia herrerae]